MQCNEIKEMLSAYIDGVLDEQETSEVEKHIRTCSLCYQELTALRETVKLLNSLGEVTPPEEFKNQLLVKLKAVPQEVGGEEDQGDGPKLSKFRQLFSGINKYLAAAVLMIGLGIGTGLYELGILSTGMKSFDLAYNLKAPKTTTQSPELGTPEIAKNVPMDTGSASIETGETSSVKSREQVSEGSGSVSEGPDSASQQAENARKAAAPPGLGELNPSDKVIIAPDSPTSSDSPMRAMVKEPAEDTAVEKSADGSAEAPAEGTSEGFMGTAAGTPPEDYELKIGTQVVQNSLLAIEVEDELEIKVPTVSSEAESLSTENAPGSVESKSWWILPGALLTVGIACAGYYFYRRWCKN